MRMLGRFAVGTLGAFCLVWLAVFAYGLLIEHLPITRNWWRAHAAIVYGFEIWFSCLSRCHRALSRRLFPRRAAASAFACTLAAGLSCCPDGSGLLRSSVVQPEGERGVHSHICVGVPLIVLAIQRWRPRPASRQAAQRRFRIPYAPPA